MENPPAVTVLGLTEDQIATLELLGNPPEIEARRGVIQDSDPPGKDMIYRYWCPIVEYRGRVRQILPNGDIRQVEPLSSLRAP